MLGCIYIESRQVIVYKPKVILLKQETKGTNIDGCAPHFVFINIKYNADESPVEPNIIHITMI